MNTIICSYYKRSKH